MRVLAKTDHKRMAWKNGGGETVEVLVHPPGAGLSEFDWRVSMAHVAADGPFSCFEGIDRTLALLDGEGMRLRIEGQGETTLTGDSAPLSFPADAPTEAFLLGGPIMDLNVMTRRGRMSHRVEAHRQVGRMEIAPAAGWTLILPRGAARLSAGEAASVTLEAGDAVLLGAGEPSVTLTADDVRVFVARIEPA